MVQNPKMSYKENNLLSLYEYIYAEQHLPASLSQTPYRGEEVSTHIRSTTSTGYSIRICLVTSYIFTFLCISFGIRFEHSHRQPLSCEPDVLPAIFIHQVRLKRF